MNDLKHDIKEPAKKKESKPAASMIGKSSALAKKDIPAKKPAPVKKDTTKKKNQADLKATKSRSQSIKAEIKKPLP